MKRPDNLAVYAILNEAKRLAKTREYRRFKPPVVCALAKLVADLPPPQNASGALLQLIGIYRSQLNADDVRVACKDLELQQHTEAILSVIVPHLHNVFDSVLHWQENGDVTASIGATKMETLPLEVPIKNGKLHGIISYDKEVYEFVDGILLPSHPLNAQLIDQHYDEESLHRILVEQMGVEKYLATSKRAQSWSKKGTSFVFTDRFAILKIGKKTVRAPCRMNDLTEALRWYEAKQKEGE